MPSATFGPDTKPHATRKAAETGAHAASPYAGLSAHRLAWISITLGVISVDLDAIALAAAIFPVFHWYTVAQELFGPGALVALVMLVLGGPPAIIGILCAASARRDDVFALSTLGVAACVLGLTIPISYAAFILMYLRGLI